MAKEAGLNVLLSVAGNPMTDTGDTISITVAAAVYTLVDSAAGFNAAIKVGGRVHVTGFAANDDQLDFTADVVSVTTGDIVFENPRNAAGAAFVPVAEAAGPEVTVAATEFILIKGQRDGRMSGAGNAIDTSDKTTGGWGSSLAGTRNMTVECSGIAEWPDLGGLDAVRQAWEAGERIDFKFLLNSKGAAYIGQFAITRLDIGGAADGATEYSFTLQNSQAPAFVAGS